LQSRRSRETRIPLDGKVAFLLKPNAYPEHPRHVEAIETRLSWVFLTERHAYKLKKPKRLPHLDFTTLAARRANCLTEIRLNRRLASDVYLGLVGLFIRPDGSIRLGRRPGQRDAVADWLVWMVRLPQERRLDERTRAGTLAPADVTQLGRVLSDFYRSGRPDPMAPADYQRRFEEDIRRNLDVTVPRAPGPLAEQARHAAALQSAFLAEHGALLRARAAEGHIVEGHGDLRPEHVFLDSPPRIIDCLEFSRDLRMLDPVDELAYLALECERLGVPEVGEAILDLYRDQCGDAADPRLIAFYRSFRASLRARLAAGRLDDAPAAPARRLARPHRCLSPLGHRLGHRADPRRGVSPLTMESKSMWRVFVLLMAATCLAPVTAHGKDRVVGWSLESDGAGQCLILSEYRIAGHPEVEAVIGMSVTGGFRMFRLHFLRTDFELTIGAVYDVPVSIDQRWTGQGSVEVATSNMFDLVLPLTRDVLDALMRGSTLSVHGRKSTVSILLTGTRVAIPALLDCAAGLPGRHRGINPFDGETGSGNMM